MRKVILGIACCALVAPLAFGKDSKRTKDRAYVSEGGVTVTATGAPARVEGGAVASYQPARTLVVLQNGPGRYVLNGRGHVFNSRGELVRTPVTAGTPVRVYFANDGGVRTIDHVVID
jgi:hypothetical protein